MKKHFLITLLLMAFAMAATAQNKKIAILETVDKKGDVPYGILLQLRSNLTYAISNTPGYEGYDRVDMSQILGEHDFQRTGLVSDEQIRKLGVMAGVSSIVIAEAAVYDKDNIIITAKILNVETASVERAVPPQISSTDPEKMQKACEGLADKLLAKEPIEIEISETETMIETELLSKSEGRDFYGNKYKYYSIRERKLSDEEYMEILKNCPEAWFTYEKGCKQRKTGRILLIAGGSVALGFTAIGGIAYETNKKEDTLKATDYLIAGLICAISFGAPPALASIPFYISGTKKKDNAYKIYNEYCAKPTAKLSFGPTANGIGVCLSF